MYIFFPYVSELTYNVISLTHPPPLTTNLVGFEAHSHLRMILGPGQVTRRKPIYRTLGCITIKVTAGNEHESSLEREDSLIQPEPSATLPALRGVWGSHFF